MSRNARMSLEDLTEQARVGFGAIVTSDTRGSVTVEHAGRVRRFYDIPTAYKSLFTWSRITQAQSESSAYFDTPFDTKDAQLSRLLHRFEKATGWKVLRMRRSFSKFNGLVGLLEAIEVEAKDETGRVFRGDWVESLEYQTKSGKAVSLKPNASEVSRYRVETIERIKWEVV